MFKSCIIYTQTSDEQRIIGAKTPSLASSNRRPFASDPYQEGKHAPFPFEDSRLEGQGTSLVFKGSLVIIKHLFAPSIKMFSFQIDKDVGQPEFEIYLNKNDISFSSKLGILSDSIVYSPLKIGFSGAYT